MPEETDVGRLIPHRGTARLVESVLAQRPDGIECLGRVPLASPFVANGRAPSFLGLEMAAQATAALEALTRTRTGADQRPRVGFLVEIRDARIEISEMPAGEAFIASVRAVGSAPPLARYEVTVRSEGVIFVTGTFSTYVPEELA